MRSTYKNIFHQVFAVLVLLTIFWNLPGPAYAVPPAQAAGLFGEGGPISIALDAATQALKKVLIAELQRRMLESLNQIEVSCPDFLRVAGTDICQRIIGDWRTYIENAVVQATRELAGEIELLNIPRDMKLALLQSIQVRPYRDAARYTLSDAVDPQKFFDDPLRYGGWAIWFEALKPQNTLLGQSIMTRERLLTLANRNREAAEKSADGPFVTDYECIKPNPKGPDGCAVDGWQLKTHASTKKEAFERIALGDFEMVVNLESIGQAIGQAVGFYIIDILDKGMFNATPAVSAQPCAGLTGEAKASCECSDKIGNSSEYYACVESKFGIINSFAVSPTEIPTSGGSITLSWTTKVSAVSCEASDSWSGSKSLSGSETINLPGSFSGGQQFTYALTCNGQAGGTETKSVTVTVISPAPTPTPVGIERE